MAEMSALDTHNTVTAQELQGMIRMRLAIIKEHPEKSQTMAPLLVHGSPGLGKSSVVAGEAHDLEMDFKDVRLAQMEPCDIKGLPVPDKVNKIMSWFVNGSWPKDPVLTIVPVKEMVNNKNGEAEEKLTSFACNNSKGGSCKWKAMVDGEGGSVEVTNIKYSSGRITVETMDNDSVIGVETVKIKDGAFKLNIPGNAITKITMHTSGVIFLDELTAADRSIQVAAYELILDRRLGDMYRVPQGWYIIAAGNNVTDHAVANTMSSALANRFLHVELREDLEAWLSWGRSSNIHPAVIGFVQYRPKLLFSDENQNQERGWPTPRSWHRVSEELHNFEAMGMTDKVLLRKLVYGLVGNGAGVEFMSFYETNLEFANVLAIMRNPKATIEIPERPDRKFAMVSSMVYNLWKPAEELTGDPKLDKEVEAELDLRLDGFLRITIEFTSDFACLAIAACIDGKDAKARQMHASRLLKHPRYNKWKDKHQAGLAARPNLFKF